MKDIHDIDTMDMAAFERSFRKYPNIRMHRKLPERVGSVIDRIEQRLEDSIHAKLYAAEALRRSDK